MAATTLNLLVPALLLITTLIGHDFVVAKPAPQSEVSPYFTTLDALESSDGADNYYVSYVEPARDDYQISRLRRGFYYIDDGYITPVAASAALTPSSSSVVRRRQSDDGSNHYKPLLSYKQQHRKHKKLFVPNLYG